MKPWVLGFSFLVLTFIYTSCGNKKSSEVDDVIDSLSLNYSIISTLPHNAESFTEGLVIYNNKILESTGLNGKSWIAEVNPESGQHEKKVILDNRYFGEGITVLHDKLYQLTYRDKIGFVYDAKSYKKIREFNYSSEGWGITHDNKNLIMSDGTDKLYFLDTTNLMVVRTLKVKYPVGNGIVKKINELEYVNGYIFANVWETSLILKIDPATGEIAGYLDLYALSNEIKRMYPDADVLNGIAYDQNSNALLITGKLWPKSYLIRLQ